jgi:aminoglycoside phosphotransferase (APT) family kinase protein
MDDTDQVLQTLALHAADLGLDGRQLTIAPIMNVGGFVNHSFRVSDGRVRYFLKLAADAEASPGLARWRAVAPILAQRYRAPRMVGWIDVGPPVRSGPIFEWIEGDVPKHLEAVPIETLSSVIRSLHADTELASLLASADDPITSCADAYSQGYHRRFHADLEFIASDPPPFVDERLLGWLRTEALELRSRVASAGAFEEPADRPTHGDLWLNNLLLATADRWFILDWDGLALGDPVLDWAMLFGPSRTDVRSRAEQVHAAVSLDSAERDRLDLYARASVLDWIIDPLSDWVQAANEPRFGPELRTDNERVHRAALATYRACY